MQVCPRTVGFLLRVELQQQNGIIEDVLPIHRQRAWKGHPIQAADGAVHKAQVDDQRVAGKTQYIATEREELFHLIL